MFDKQVLQTIIFVMFNKQARQATNIFLIYRKQNTTLL